MRYRPFGASGKAVSAISLLLREAPNMTTPHAWRAQHGVPPARTRGPPPSATPPPSSADAPANSALAAEAAHAAATAEHATALRRRPGARRGALHSNGAAAAVRRY